MFLKVSLKLFVSELGGLFLGVGSQLPGSGASVYENARSPNLDLSLGVRYIVYRGS